MLYGFIHLVLLLAATLGLWAIRSQTLLVICGLLLFPLPAAMYNYFAAPVPPIATILAEPPPSPIDCAQPEQRPQGETSETGKEEERNDSSKPACPQAPGPKGQPVLLVVLLVNYLTVFLGFAAGMLCRPAMARR